MPDPPDPVQMLYEALEALHNAFQTQDEQKFMFELGKVHGVLQRLGIRLPQGDSSRV